MTTVGSEPRRGPAADRRSGVVDACVHPSVGHPDDLREYMEPPWRHRHFPGPERYHHHMPAGEYWAGARDEGLPGSDAGLIQAYLDANATDRAILLPTTRGLNPDLDLAIAICRGTNEWLAARWLDPQGEGGRFAGTIRVDPRDADEAVREIGRWSSHPGMVQVGVPLQALEPYGSRRYFPVWEAAARHGLPVAVHLEGGGGIGFPSTSAGEVRSGAEYNVMAPLNHVWHLVSLIGEGVFERLADLRFVFADGGHDLALPIVWRLDKDWRPARREMPWVQRPPSEYMAEHVRFVAHRLEGPPEGDRQEPWLGLSRAAALLVYGSRYPRWVHWPSTESYSRAPAGVREAILSGNARALYPRLR